MAGKHRLIFVFVIGAILALTVGSLLQKLGVFSQSPASHAGAGAPSEVAAAYKQIEKALREGDGKLYLSLMDRKTRSQMDARYKATLEQGIPPRHWVHMEPVAVDARGDHAFVHGHRETDVDFGVCADALTRPTCGHARMLAQRAGNERD